MSLLFGALGLLGLAKTVEQIEGQMYLNQVQREMRDGINKGMQDYKRLKREEEERKRPYREGVLPDKYKRW